MNRIESAELLVIYLLIVAGVVLVGFLRRH
jgi:hypothetical protein